jgi:hypothetical protein
VEASKNGRARIGSPAEAALKRADLSSRKNAPPSAPNVWPSLSQAPRAKRPPERTPPSTSDPPKSTAVPGAPNTPACCGGVPAGLAVTRGGTEAPFIHHRRYSASAQIRPRGPQMV